MSEPRYDRLTITCVVASLLLGMSSVSSAQTVLINTDSSIAGGQRSAPTSVQSAPPLPMSNQPAAISTPPLPTPQFTQATVEQRVWQTEDGPVVETVEPPARPEKPHVNTTAPPLPVKESPEPSDSSDRTIVSSPPLPSVDVRRQEQSSGQDNAVALPIQTEEQRPAFTPIPKETWRLKPGSLREQLLKWGNDSSSWHVLWFGSNDYTVQVDYEVQGDLDEAVIDVVKAFVAQGAAINIVRSRANSTIAIRSSQQ